MHTVSDNNSADSRTRPSVPNDSAEVFETSLNNICSLITVQSIYTDDLNSWEIERPSGNDTCWSETTLEFEGSEQFGSISLCICTNNVDNQTVVQLSSSRGCSLILNCSGVRHSVDHRN